MAIQRLKEKYEKTGTTKRQKGSGSGRPKKWSKRDSREIERCVLNSKVGTVVDAHKRLRMNNTVPLHYHIVRHIE